MLHFDGKFWNTLPLLVWKPGELTRRYVHGERAKFISPMALFLFSIFMMFAVFSYVGTPNFTDDQPGMVATNGIKVTGWREGMQAEMVKLEAQIEEKTKASQALGADDAGSAALSAELQDLKAQVNGLSIATEGKARYPELLGGSSGEGTGQFDLAGDVDTGWKSFDKLVNKMAAKANKNPELLLYKLQSNGYKFAWLLIPLSIPFVWLATLGKRGHRFYDHAVFTTYSIAFMSLLFIVVTLASKFNILPGLITTVAIFYAPFHMYRQLRHAYGSSRIGAVFRLVLLLTCTIFVVTAFVMVLISLGLIG
ncbi:DUF3667 domain-containing protein [Blastomonas aquatica]|uniref:DUF3667 domain-containing protein n=1 Tax=Blastomonas aquatica TaxID=1510276 RepID=UPI001E368BEB|nr:DUF3667 domain-containing protein [Blastomonas aquatica]